MEQKNKPWKIKLAGIDRLIALNRKLRETKKEESIDKTPKRIESASHDEPFEYGKSNRFREML